MINNILAFWMPGPWELIVIFIVFGVPVLLIILLVRHLSRSDKERRRLRLEVSKLADEVEQKRKQAKGDEEDNSPDKSD